jgi:hypothetical protein
MVKLSRTILTFFTLDGLATVFTATLAAGDALGAAEGLEVFVGVFAAVFFAVAALAGTEAAALTTGLAEVDLISVVDMQCILK